MTGSLPSVNIRSDDERGEVLLQLHSPLPHRFEIGRGQFLVVSGDCVARDGHVASVSLLVGERNMNVELSVVPGGVCFWQAVFFDRDTMGTAVPVKARVGLAGGAVVERELGRIHCQDVQWEPAPLSGTGNKDGMVAICMATYNPEIPAFERQVDSIRGQSYGNWICIVNDDGTRADLWTRMRACCADDDRFMFFRNAENLGFYRNFEAVLKKVPEHVEYVAFSDQDDRWYPDKLTRLIEKLETEDALLAYSDMHIVNEAEKKLASTYWVNRKNEYRDLAVVLVANTVTGAASLFRRSLLEYLVPFPPRVGDAFHDHWLACVSMSIGRLAYVDAPLYSYYQYGDSVIGHCDFIRFPMKQRIVSAARFVFRMLRPRIAGPLLKQKYASALAIYRGECRRLRLVGNTITRRCRPGGARARQLRMFDGGLKSLAMLMALHAKVLFKGQTTDDAELRLAMGELARMVERRRRKRHENS